MMTKNKPILLVLLALTAAALACGLPEAEPKTGDDQVATIVAGTMTALASEPEPEPSSTELAPPLEATVTATTIPTPALAIAYIDGGDVWLIKDGSSPAQLTSSGDAEQVFISPDGMKIIFLRRADQFSPLEIRAINHDGAGEVILVTAEHINSLYPLGLFTHNDVSSMAFIPGTHEVLFNTVGVPTGPGLIKYDDLLRLDVDTGVLSTLLPAGSGGDFLASPDGSQIAILRPDSIGLVDSDGSNLRPNLVAFPTVITYSEFQYYPQPVWASDSSALLVAIPSEDPLATGTHGQIWSIPAGGGPAAQIADIDGDFYFTQVFTSPVIAPDLSHIAFIRDQTSPDILKLYLSNVDGSDEILYATGDITWQGWSPEGIHFVYSIDGALDNQIGAIGESPAPLVYGIRIHWINSDEFLFLTGGYGSWVLNKGHVDGTVTVLASSASASLPYDFTK